MKPPTLEASWIVCQLGAREHYAVAQALHRRGQLDRLVTDAWCPPGAMVGLAKRSLRERYHAGLADARVVAANQSCIAFELQARARGLTGWPLIMARNDWFQNMAVARLTKAVTGGGPLTLFAYSYAALDIFRHARAQGWRTVLGQIDPGLPEERIVSRLYEANPEQRGQWQPAPVEYWRRWREECEIADSIVVNSEWSRRALIEESVPAEKIRIVPLAYEAPPEVTDFKREYPERFTSGRPLRVLFLGQINLRKGTGPLFDAIRLLTDEPVEFWFAGQRQITVPEDLEINPSVKWFGHIHRSATARFYREADVFIFPTHSDGFGLTQLEAQGWGLPVIASRFCGAVVEDGRNGTVLAEVTGPAIAEALRACLAAPERLREMAARAVAPAAYGLENAGRTLADVFADAQV